MPRVFDLSVGTVRHTHKFRRSRKGLRDLSRPATKERSTERQRDDVDRRAGYVSTLIFGARTADIRGLTSPSRLKSTPFEISSDAISIASLLTKFSLIPEIPQIPDRQFRGNTHFNLCGFTRNPCAALRLGYSSSENAQIFQGEAPGSRRPITLMMRHGISRADFTF